jgi:hypothetical protein
MSSSRVATLPRQVEFASCRDVKYIKRDSLWICCPGILHYALKLKSGSIVGETVLPFQQQSVSMVLKLQAIAVL